MTKITEDISKQIYDLWNEGNLTKAEVAEKFNTSEDVVKYHIQKQKGYSTSQAPASGDVPQKSIKGFLKGLLGKEDKDKIIETLADKLEELTTRLEQLPAATSIEKPHGCSVKQSMYPSTSFYLC
jgi:orotate phosphoribosyltransferase-like protein